MRTGKRQRKSRGRLVCTCACFLTVLTAATTAAAGTYLDGYTPRSDCEISLYEGQTAQDDESNESALSAGTITSSEVFAQSQTAAPDQQTVQAQRQTDSQSAAQSALSSGLEAKNQKPDSPYFHVEDADQVWSTETSVDIFKTSYHNQDGRVTVASGDSDKVIAPGTEGSYTFTLKNTGKQEADYKVWIETSISSALTGAELKTRMTGREGWILGERDTWKSISELDGVSEESHLAAGKSADYTISWQWPFEQEDDAHDTSLGNLGGEQDLTCTVTIYTVAAGSTGGHNSGSSGSSGDGTENNGAGQNPFQLGGVRTGDTSHLALWTGLAAVSAGVIVFLIFRRKKQKENTDEAAG